MRHVKDDFIKIRGHSLASISENPGVTTVSTDGVNITKGRFTSQLMDV